jgi:Txe/YoeB family toxin of toxin-antitoxin system
VLESDQVVSWQLVYTHQAQKDAKKLVASGLRKKAELLLEILRENPFQIRPPYEKLRGDLAGAYSRRINIQHRRVYEVIEEQKTVKVIRIAQNADLNCLTETSLLVNFPSVHQDPPQHGTGHVERPANTTLFLRDRRVSQGFALGSHFPGYGETTNPYVAIRVAELFDGCSSHFGPFALPTPAPIAATRGSV